MSSHVRAAQPDDAFVAEWRRWHAGRVAAVAAPRGSLTLTGTHWVSDDTVIDGVPGVWRVRDDRVWVSGARGLTADGVPLEDGPVPDGQWLAVGDLELTVIRRGNDRAVRTFDPHAPAVRDFVGIDAYEPDPAWLVHAEFRPTAGDHTEHIRHSNTDREADYPVVGTFAFERDGHRVEMVGLDTGDRGRAHLTFRDATSGRETYGAARFLFVPLPAAPGPVTLDFNRAILPPCAFSDAFLCPLPPDRNVLPFAVRAGEKQVVRRGQPRPATAGDP